MNLLKYIENGISYAQYKSDIQQIIEDEKGGDLAKYYPLNLQRIQRLEKKISLNEEQKNELSKIDKKTYLLIITEGWCGDAAQIVPMVQKLVESSDLLEEKIVYRDENQDLMNEYLTNGGQSIPIIVGVDADGNSLFRWGPRPQFGMDLLKEYKDGKMSKEDFGLNLQKKYNQDKGQSIINELINKIKSNA